MLGLPKDIVIHFIGIGGIGMSGIAEVLIDFGYKVTGSDMSPSPVTEKLKSMGAVIYNEHVSTNVDNASIVVYSTAIDTLNPEIIKAKAQKIPLVKRAEMLSELMRLKFGIAIAGSHGKTTTTSLVATIFNEAHLDPTHIIGGVVQNLGGHAKKGEGKYLIAEADESDGSFLYLNPVMSVITNIDNDHLDYYKTEENLLNTFVEFINKVPFYGVVALNNQDQNIQKILPLIKRRYVRFGIAQNLNQRMDLDYCAEKITYKRGETEFDFYRKGVKLTRFKTAISGVHNVYNTLAAISVSLECDISLDIIQSALLKFQGVGRRLESLYSKDKFEIIDDYGHHPTEIKATLKTIKEIYNKKICVVFEPHRYTRTKQLWNDFLASFDLADEIFIAPIYSASEPALPGISAEKFAQELAKNKKKASYLSSLDQMKDVVQERSNQDIILLTLGAGAISKKIKLIIKELK